jgi:hypothetical protein
LVNRWQELQQINSQPIRGNEGNEIEVMYEKISAPRNDELMVVNSLRPVDNSRTVKTYLYVPYNLNDQTPGKSVNSCYGFSFPIRSLILIMYLFFYQEHVPSLL